ncbi:MAG: hypothetical protein CSA81_08050 [Acidobacteria bacterium]|nr:MAG: hypothetical protein CSA81_08050 [Acidobacteriota bacterium]
MTGKKTRWFFAISLSLITILIFEVVLLQNSGHDQAERAQKSTYIQLVSLPDLAFSGETRSIRHRSLSDSFSIFNEGPEIRDFFTASFVYSPSFIVNKQPSRMKIEQ